MRDRLITHERFWRSAMTRRFTVIIAVLTAALATMCTSITSAEPPPGPYVALGDSYSSGVGTNQYDVDLACQRSSQAYPGLWQEVNRPAGFGFLACGGAQIGDVRDQVSGSEILPQAELVTLTAGGNDAGFGDIMSVCTSTATTDDQCYAAVELGENTAMSSEFHDGLVSLLTLIHDLALDSNIIVLGYPTLFEETFSCAAVAPAQQRRVRINDGADVLKSAIRRASQDYRMTSGNRKQVQFVDVDRYFENHRICSASPWINGFLPQTPGESFHPNAAGHANGYLPALTAATQKLELAAA